MELQLLKPLVCGLIVLALWPLAAQADCSNMHGAQIALMSSSYDPDVLVWDSQKRLSSYAANSYEVAKLLLPHALLARAGTLGIIITCKRNVVHAKYHFSASDVVSVRMTSGEYRGRNGWVMMDDVHVVADRATHRRHP